MYRDEHKKGINRINHQYEGVHYDFTLFLYTMRER